MYLIIFYIFIQQLFAKELQLEIQNIRYQISYTDEKIEYKAPYKELSLTKKECNQHLFKQFNKRMDDILSTPFSTKSEPGFYKIMIDKKTFYGPLKSMRAEIFKNMDALMTKTKSEELLNCENQRAL